MPAEGRLYLYRKAGREVWDAEMWLPDGRRRVWRTGISERSQAEQAARARLKALLAQAQGAGVHAESAASGAAPRGTPGAASLDVTDVVVPASEAHPTASLQLAEPTPASAVPAPPPAWSARFDRWFFGDLASLFS